VIPVLIGNLIPLPHKLDVNMEQFSHVMLLLFRPWKKPSELLNNFSCWTEAFDAYHFSNSLSQVISNFLIEMECKDARDGQRARYKV
ncbi:hypothetical protein F5J12DRAFT_728072, partial [Pisolithus orientalis]|uniref:uncharacterized protein n=1 Tax=Pisolithus orientalis TaxID=936130 RepID=UPI0022248FA4